MRGMRGLLEHRVAIVSGTALALDGALLSTAPSAMIVIILSAAVLVAIIWLSLVQLRREGKPHNPYCAAKEMGRALVVATAEFLVFAIVRGYPLLDTLFCIGAAILTVLWLTAGLAHMVDLLSDPRKLRRFFNQPW